ncbi:Sugar phosphatase YidA [compost metagenome]
MSAIGQHEINRQHLDGLQQWSKTDSLPFKLIACDMDGTLLGADHQLSLRTIGTLRAVAERGATILLATGRMLGAVRNHLDRIDLPGIVVAHNGALVKHASSGHIYHHERLPILIARGVIELTVERSHIRIHWNCDDEIYITGENPLSAKFSADLEVALQVIHSFADLTEEPTSLLVMGSREELVPVLEEILARYKGQVDYVFIPWYDNVWQLQFLPLGTSKGKGVLSVASLLGISPEEIVSFGDSYNDLELIRDTGLGIAMDNAVPEIKQIARFVTLSHQEDGVAAALEVLFGL